jgi:hypothetical protein
MFGRNFRTLLELRKINDSRLNFYHPNERTEQKPKTFSQERRRANRYVSTKRSDLGPAGPSPDDRAAEAEAQQAFIHRIGRESSAWGIGGYGWTRTTDPSIMSAVL